MKSFAFRVACCVALLAPPSFVSVCAAQDVIPLYPGPAPGNPAQSYPEQQYFSKAWNVDVVTNVSKPAMIVFKPTGATSGSAVVICPGGGYVALSISSEGTEVAKYLAARGMTAFVLKYRVAPTTTDATQLFRDTWQNDRPRLEKMIAADLPLAVADGLAAVAWVRQHAAEYGVSPDRVGIMGFSAGGGVTTGVAFGYKPESRPAFVAPIYGGGDDFSKLTVPKDAPAMFIAAATDDNLGLAPVSVGLYAKWVAANRSAELHMYAKGGHGFGMHKAGIPTDQWIDRFAEWLELEGFLKE